MPSDSSDALLGLMGVAGVAVVVVFVLRALQKRKRDESAVAFMDPVEVRRRRVAKVRWDTTASRSPGLRRPCRNASPTSSIVAACSNLGVIPKRRPLWIPCLIRRGEKHSLRGFVSSLV